VKRKIVNIFIVIALLITVSGSMPRVQGHYQDAPSAAKCLENAYQHAGREQRIHRSVLFGKKKAKDDPIGAIRYSKEFIPWKKTEEGEWKTLHPDYEFTTWGDAIWEEQDEVDILAYDKESGDFTREGSTIRRGILEIKKVGTSELISSMQQSIRALQCRLKAVCKAASRSLDKDIDPDEDIHIQPEGCEVFTFQPFRGCLSEDHEHTSMPIARSTVKKTCATAMEALLTQEVELLKMVASYDAAYRSILQFAGIFEQHLGDVRFPLIEPLWDVSHMMNSFNRIPCYLSQCEK
jgi:hypothetical protein